MISIEVYWNIPNEERLAEGDRCSLSSVRRVVIAGPVRGTTRREFGRKRGMIMSHPWRTIRWSEQRQKRHERAIKGPNSCTLFPVFPRYSSAMIIRDVLFLKTMTGWQVEKRHGIRDDSTAAASNYPVFTVSYSDSVVFDAVLFLMARRQFCRHIVKLLPFA